MRNLSFRGQLVRAFTIDEREWLLGSDVLTLCYGRAIDPHRLYAKLAPGAIRTIPSAGMNLGKGSHRKVLIPVAAEVVARTANYPHIDEFVAWMKTIPDLMNHEPEPEPVLPRLMRLRNELDLIIKEMSE